MSYYSAVLLLVLASAVAVNAQTCTSRSKYVGFTGKLTMIDHMVSCDVCLLKSAQYDKEQDAAHGHARPQHAFGTG